MRYISSIGIEDAFNWHLASDHGLSVLELGAVGNGRTDDTAAIQAALDKLTTGQDLIFPAGEYLVSSTLLMRNKSGAALRGQGKSSEYQPGTKLRWTGAAGGVLLDASGCNHCTIENIGFFANASAAGTGTTQTGLLIKGNPTYNGSFFNTIAYCNFQNFGVGIDIGTAAGIDQVDSCTIEKCWFYYGVDGIGIRNRSSNALVNQIINCTFTTAGSPTTATAIYVDRGSVKLFGNITALNHYGVRLDTPIGSSSIIAHHSESDDFPIYTPIAGTHQRATALTIMDFYAYDPKQALFYLGYSDLLYTLIGIYCTPVAGSDVILVSDNCSEVFAQNVTNTAGVKRASDGVTAERIYGLRGQQGPAGSYPRTMNLPATDIKPEGALLPLKVTGFNAGNNLIEAWYSNNPQFVVAPDGSVIYVGYSIANVCVLGGCGPASEAGVQLVETKLYRVASGVLRTPGKLIADTGIGVGNAAAATTPGAVVKKIEVFDSAGNSIGYLPVYNAIT